MEANTNDVVESTTPAAQSGAIPAQVWVEGSKFMDIVKAAGLQYVQQSGFFKVLGPKGNQLYIATTKTCRRIDISGFDAGPVLAGPPKAPNGNVTGMMRMESLSEAEQLERFTKLVELLKTQPAKVPAPKPPRAPKAPKAEGSSSSTASTPAAGPVSREAAINERLQAIAKIATFAEKNGHALSPKVSAEKEALEAELLSLSAPAPVESNESIAEA